MSDGGGCLWKRSPAGRVPVVGVAGNTLTELCGDRPSLDPEAEERPEGDAIELLDVLDAFECVCWWLGWCWYVLRIEETEEDVDLRPRSPEVLR